MWELIFVIVRSPLFFGVLTIVSGVVRGIMDREGIFLMFWEEAVGNLFMSLILMNRDHIALWEN